MNLSEKYLPGYGPLSAKIVIVTDCPGYEEAIADKQFIGGWAKELDRLLRDAGINRNDCWLTSASKFYVPPPVPGTKMTFTQRATAAGVNIDEQFNDLRQELNAIKPNVVIALGGSALWAMTGKSKIVDYRGSILHGMGHKVIGTYNPRDLITYGKGGEVFGYWNRQIVIFDLKRAKAQSAFRDLRLPSRSLNVCRNSEQLANFLARHQGKIPSVDIENDNTSKCLPVCIGLAFTKYEGLTVPLWNHSGISSIPDSDLASIWYILGSFLASTGAIGQNFGFDRDKIKRLGFLIKYLHSDTMLKAFAINPELPKNLAFLTSTYTEEPFYKNEGMYEGSYNDLFIGCARDACVTKEVDQAQDIDLDEMGLRPYYENFVLPLHDLYAYIESEGLRTDESIREELITKYVEWDERIRFELYNLTGSHINSSSPKQVASLLYDNWKLPRRKGTGEEVITGLLNLKSLTDVDKRRGMELILEDRRVKKTLSSYLLSPTDFDGRMRTSYFICLDTGRSSSNQQEPPIRPSIEVRDEDGKKKKKSLGMAFQTITKHGDIGPEVRTMFTTDEGEIYLQADSSQAEARVVFLLAEDYQALEDIDKHDYHALTASWFFGGTEFDYSKKVLGYEHPIRFAGKTLRHAGHLGAGKGRAATELNTQARKYHIDISISESTADTALKIFHKKQPKIKGVFQASVIKCLEKSRQLTAPVPYGIDAPKGGTRIFFERWGDELFRQAFSYIPQRTVSENIKAAALRIRRNHSWIRILAESHDALLTSVPIPRKQEAAIILRTELSRPIDFSKCSIPRGELIIPCDVEEGIDFYKFTKFKFLLPESV